MNKKIRIRETNGYIAIYKPDHPRAMKNDNWKGFIYEHIVIAEKYLGRYLYDNEVIHHLDNNPTNNRQENLLILDSSQHRKLHQWINKVKTELVFSGNYFDRSVTKEFPKYDRCEICNTLLQDQQIKCCSKECIDEYQILNESTKRNSSKPSPEQLQEDMDNLPWTEIGKKYGVSDNAAKKWAKNYGLDVSNKKRIIVNKAKPTTSKYKTERERLDSRNKRKRERYKKMTDEEKHIRKFGHG